MQRFGLASVSADQLFFGLSTFVVVAALLLGGGTRSGFVSDTLLQLIALPLVLVSLWRLADAPLSYRAKWVLIFCFLVVLVPLIQLVPLPPSIWTALPGREPVVAAFELLGRGLPWMPISVSPHATWLAVLSLIVPLAVFLSVLLLDYSHRRVLSLVILAVGVVCVFLGLFQVAQGRSSGLYLYEFSNPDEAVGFFANKNHFAALLYVLMVFAAAWASNAALNQSSNRGAKWYDTSAILSVVASFAVVMIFVTAQILARSRAGLGLAIVALLCAFLLVFADRRNATGVSPIKLLIGAVILAVMFASQFALFRVLERFALDPAADWRIPFARTTIKAAEAFMPFGSGMGTFVPVYAMFEKQEDLLPNVYANRAHNDLIELWLESGVIGLGLAAIFTIWLIVRAWDVWGQTPFGEREIDHSLARAATLAIGLLLLHSIVDYPLRTGAIAAVMAFACALLIEPQISKERAVSSTPNDRRKIRDQEWQGPSAIGAGASLWAGPATNQASAPHTPAQQAPSPPGKRWGQDVEWPEEWRKPPKQRDPGSKGE